MADGVNRLGKLYKVAKVGAMRKIMISSTSKNLAASSQIDVGFLFQNRSRRYRG